MSRHRVCIHGHDGMGWSIDQDRRHLERFIRDMGHTVTQSYLTADIVHSVWWNRLLSKRDLPIRLKRSVIATASNFISSSEQTFQKAKRFVNLWIAPSTMQEKVLLESGVDVAYQPFYVDESLFQPMRQSKSSIARTLGIDGSDLDHKVLLGSFQRDTVGEDLASPKRQKGPDLLVEILSQLPNKSRWMLVLAGPRRHYVTSECQKRGIPYCFVGDHPQPNTDDVATNTLSAHQMVMLYNLVDCYIVSSRSEGGPKAVLEASFTQTPIISTRVGMAPDALKALCLYDTAEEAVRILVDFVSNPDESSIRDARIHNFQHALDYFSYNPTLSRWKDIYARI